MASLPDDGDEEFLRDAAPNKKVHARDLISGRLLGKGSSSMVYETTWEGKSYARKDFLRVSSDIFAKEAAVLVDLDDHPNVLRTYCWTVDEGSCSLVIELMDDDLLNMMQKRKYSQQKRKVPGSGPSDASQASHLIDLHKFIEDGKNAPGSSALESVASTSPVYRFSLPEALHIMLQIAEGIVFLHENGVVHGDLKPKNILVTPGGRTTSDSDLDEKMALELKVADFGLVGTKTTSKTLVSRQARKLEMVRWRAPELLDVPRLLSVQDEGEPFTDSDWDSDSSDGKTGGFIHKLTYGKLARADVYSFALTCSQILTGEDPYSGLGLTDLVRKVSDGGRPGLPRRCPTQLSELINRCWGEEFKRPTFIDILSELKDLQASLAADTWVDVKKTTITGPNFELTVSLTQYVTEKFEKNQPSKKPGGSSNPMVRTPLRSSETSEKVDLPIAPEKHSIKNSQESSRLKTVPKKRRRRKVYGCLGSLGCMPPRTINGKENEDITTPPKRSAKNAQNMKGLFGKAASKPYSPNDKRYTAEIGRTIGAKSYTLAEVTAMTRNFKTKIGTGGIRPVFYGKLPDLQEVAVKVHDASSHQGYQEFVNEIDVLSRVRHKNVVALVGYCHDDKHRIVIYEYMENGSLHDHLHGNHAEKAGSMLDWKTRLRIALDVAQGLEYLHIGCKQSFIHGDIKGSNILLTAKFDAKLTDFGLSKLMAESVTHVVTQVKGTAGYLDPEFYMTQVLSTKTDIFGFGVVLLELITGQPPIVHSESPKFENQYHICNWVRAAAQKGNIDMVVDPALKSSGAVPKQETLWKVAEIALQCVEPKGIYRPRISAVIQELYQAMELEEPSKGPDWERPLDNTIPGVSVTDIDPTLIETSVKLTEPPEPQSVFGDSWLSEKKSKPQLRQKPVWSSPSTNSAKRRFARRRKGFSCLERLGCISEKAVSIGEENKDLPTTTFTISNRSPWLRRRAEKNRAENALKIGRYIAAESFTLAEVTEMTRNFKTKIGSGGFGPVYYGKLPDLQEVAVKVNDASSRQGYQEFVNEIDVLSRVRHKNVVALVGYCHDDKHRIVIYEYMENGSLHDHLHGNHAEKAGSMLDWKTRLRIALDVAQGLEYLHTGCSPQVIHHDVKSGNILLAGNFDAKLTDFGLTKLMAHSVTHVSTFVQGTAGYIDPEYFVTSQLSTKSDIFSFGVVLLELVTGQPPKSRAKIESGFNIRDWVRAAAQKGNIDMVVDPALKSSGPVPKQESLWRVAEIALQCVEPKGRHRPSISTIVQELQQAMEVEESLPAPSAAPLEGYDSASPEIVSEIGPKLLR